MADIATSRPPSGGDFDRSAQGDPGYTAQPDPAYAAPSDPAYAMPPNPAYAAPSDSAYAAQPDPTYTAPSDPTYAPPSDPTYAPPSDPTNDAPSDSTAQTAIDQTKAVGQSAAQAGSTVVDSAKEQGQQVAAEAKRQVGNVYQQARSQVSEQAGAQQKKAVDGLYALGDEVGKMAEQGGQSGPATQLARQASDKIRETAQWLEGREPGHVLDEVKRYARRNPGTFLLGAAVLGLVAGRLTKNLTGDDDDDSSQSAARSTGRSSTTAGGYPSDATNTVQFSAPSVEPLGASWTTEPTVPTGAVPTAAPDQYEGRR